MPDQPVPHVRLTFGPFEVNVATGELRKRGIPVRLSGQPFQILLLLLTHQGEVVTREQLREHVWSDGTFVDFEGGMNAAVAKLRRALGDSAQHPRYIETLPGRGYRFVGRVESFTPENRSVEAAQQETSPARIIASKRVSNRQWIATGLMVITLSAAIAWGLHTSRGPSVPSWRLSPVTTSAALEDWPSLSRDGKLVVYSADPDFSGSVDLYMRQVSGGGPPVRLTTDGEGNRMPDFSPDGRRIVFRSNRGGGGIYQMPVFGGEAQLVAQRGLNPKFSPDGDRIAYWVGSESVAAAVPGSGSVWVVPVQGGEPRRIAERLTSARQPIWLPNGKSLLIVGYSSTKPLDRSSIDWWVASLDGELLIRTGLYAELVRRGIRPSDTTANSRARTPVPWIAPPGCWATREHAVIATLEGEDNGNLWAVGLSPAGRLTDSMTRLTVGAANEWNASCSSVGTLAFTSTRVKRQLWTVPFDLDHVKSNDAPRQMIENANDLENPSLTADGRNITFVSNQSGRPNIWRRDLQTGAETQVAVSPLVQRYPVLSPSGRKIAYSVYEPDKRSLYLVDSGGGPQKLCDGCARATDWSSSEDDLLVFGESPYQINLFNLASRKQTTLLKHEKHSVLYGRFSPDGRWISFTIRLRPDLARIAIAPSHGGNPIPERAWITIADVGLDDNANWSPDSKTLYFSSPKDGNNCLWAQHIDPSTGSPVGNDFAVQHFHGRVTFGHGGWMAAAGRIEIALVDTTSNVWIMSH